LDCKYCGETIEIKSGWNKTEIMCGSCGQFVDIKLEKQSSTQNTDSVNDKLNNNASKEWQDNRMAKVPKPQNNKVGGDIVKVPNLTGVDNVKRELKDKKQKEKKLKQNEAK